MTSWNFFTLNKLKSSSIFSRKVLNTVNLANDDRCPRSLVSTTGSNKSLMLKLKVNYLKNVCVFCRVHVHTYNLPTNANKGF